MPYIITDGTNYCHRTKTQAVEISPDIEKATRFRNEETAQKLLARATKKLKGFVLQEVPSKDSAAKKSARKPGRPAKKKEAPQVEAVNAAEEAAVIESTTESAAAKQPHAEAENNKPQTERRSRRSHTRRRSKNNNETAATETAQTTNEQTAAEPAKAAPAQTAPSKAEQSTQPKQPKPQAPKKPAAKPQAPSITELTARLYEMPQEAAKSEDVTAAPAQEAKHEQSQSAPVKDTPKQPEQTPTKPKYPTKFTRRKTTASTAWNIEAATSRIFDTEPVVIDKKPQTATPAPIQPAEEPAVVTIANAFQEPVQVLTPSEPVEIAVPVDVEPKAPTEAPKAEKIAPVKETPAKETPAPVKIAPTNEAPAQQVNAVAAPKAEAPAPKIEAPAPTQTAASTPAPTPHEAEAPAEEAPKAQQRGNRRSNSRRSFRNSRFDQPVQEVLPSEEKRDSEHNTRSGRERRRTDERRDNRRSSSRSHSPESTASRRRLFTQQERNLIYNRSEGHCGICGRFIPLEEYTIDHIIPLSKGGTNDLDNLQACCGFCNKAKDDSMGDEFFKRIERIYLYQAEQHLKKKQYKKLKKLIEEID